jgi:hypothetical protein
MALLGPQAMSELSPQSVEQRTLPAASTKSVYEYTPLAHTLRVACDGGAARRFRSRFKTSTVYARCINLSACRCQRTLLPDAADGDHQTNNKKRLFEARPNRGTPGTVTIRDGQSVTRNDSGWLGSNIFILGRRQET